MDSDKFLINQIVTFSLGVAVLAATRVSFESSWSDVMAINQSWCNTNALNPIISLGSMQWNPRGKIRDHLDQKFKLLPQKPTWIPV